MRLAYYLGLFLLALTTLVIEVLLTKVFEVILYPNMAFMIITCAMFGLGLGGLFDILRPLPTSTNPRANLSYCALLFALSVWALPLLLNAVPFDAELLTKQPLTQIVWFLVLYPVLVAPFFLAGLCICRLFSTNPQDIQRLYFWDLCGAALGTAVLVPLLPVLGAERVLMAAGLTGVLASALFSDSARWRGLLVAIAAVMVLLPQLLGSRYLTLDLHGDKRMVRTMTEEGRIEFTRWDPVSHISVLAESRENRVGSKHVAYDGGSQSSSFYGFDGDLAALRRDLPARLRQQFWQRGVLASHYLRRDTKHRALIIGSAAGQETKAALLYGAGEIDAIEMVPTVVALGTGHYSDYIGGIFRQPAVKVRVDEGRSFLRASSKKYDVIQIFSNYTTSSIASGSGALSPVYLQTVEAYMEYISHLEPNGILHINHHVYPRMIAIAAKAWRLLGRDQFRSHVVVVERASARDGLPTMLIKNSPWTAAEIAELTEFFSFPAAGDDTYALVENPLDPAGSFLSDDFYSGELPQALVDAVPYDVTAATDDQPFFNFMRRSLEKLTPDRTLAINSATEAILNNDLLVRGGIRIPLDWLHLIVASAGGLFYGLLFVLVPMFLSRVGHQPWVGKTPTLIYFSLLGLGFIMIELVFIQIFLKLVGYPLYALATVITVMLIGAAVGSMSSRWAAGQDSARWYVAFAGVIGTGFVLWLSYPVVLNFFMALPIALRILAAAAMIFPIAFFLGMPFPLGILELKLKPAGAVAWAWSMNGLFTTIGGVVSVLLARFIGFRLTLLAGLAAYLLACTMFAVLRSGNRRAVLAPASSARSAQAA